MSDQVLASKWRPRDFAGVIGQEAVVTALRHALTENRLHHAYLLTGTRGVGKTTIARVLAKCLNCESSERVTPEPCGHCATCRAIDEGRFIDYIEIDAASNRSVEEISSLLEQALYPPTMGRYKVYMIDEVHMLSNHAFNAMLKTLEEPPERVKFILATTDPQKVPMTVLSRCLQFNLRNMSPRAVADHLGEIIGREGLQADPAALLLLGRAAAGSMRDGLSLLDQAIAYSGGPVTLEKVREMLGAVGDDGLVKIITAVSSGQAAAALELADQLGAQGQSYAAAIRELAALLHRAALRQFVSRDGGPELADGDEAAAEVAGALTPEELQLDYQIALQARRDMPLAPDEQAGFTMALLRMMAFRPGDSQVGATVPPKIQPRPATAPAAAPAVAPDPAPRKEDPGREERGAS